MEANMHPEQPLRSPRPRIVMVSPQLPHRAIPHAGGKYVWELGQVLGARADLVLLTAPNTANDQVTASTEGVLPHLMLRPDTPWHRRLSRMARRLQDYVHRLDPAGPDLAFVALLLTDPRVRTLVRQADVVDIQWGEYSRLWPWLRILNPRARLVATFHDVDSQRLRRTAADKTGLLPRLRWRLGATIAKRFEASAASHLDRAIVFSEKDKTLLDAHRGVARAGRVIVMDPPLGSSAVQPRRPSDTPTVVLVGYFGRQVNVAAAEWLVTKVWPSVLDACPDARLRLVGADPIGSLTPLIAATPNAEVTGFVDDLWAEYSIATLTVVPLQSGAGVKFKTIESLLAGTPVVATSVGAEGIGGDDVLTAVTDDPEHFADAVIAVLRNPSMAQAKADRSRVWATTTYGRQAFQEKVEAVYFGNLT